MGDRPGLTDEGSLQFLKLIARHFVGLAYWAHEGVPPTPKRHFASCFIIKVEGTWFIVTAGHVIKNVKDAITAGIRITDFTLYDGAAGAGHKYSVPFDFDPDEWIALDGHPAGTDYAAAVLRPLFKQGLESGLIRPLDEEAWGHDDPRTYKHWLLLGVPNESHTPTPKGDEVKLSMLVLEPTDAPSDAITEGRIFGRILTRLGDPVRIQNIDGMSGGPVFGVREVEGRLRYWVIGLQASWFAGPRIVSFCGTSLFFLSIQAAVRRLTSAPA